MLKRTRASTEAAASLHETLVNAGLSPRVAALLEAMPHKTVEADPRRPLREAGASRDEVFFVQSGLLSKYKSDGSGRRQIVALRFAGDGILPREGAADYGIQAIVRSQVRIARAEDFEPIMEDNPELSRFFWRLGQRHASIGYEWLVNCGRRDSTARVAHLLCETAARSGAGFENERMVNPFTQQQIADITGQTSVNVNRVLADLERLGMIRREGRDILFCDWAELRRMASFQPAYLS
jgi:CRP-like cAMP-binding protein